MSGPHKADLIHFKRIWESTEAAELAMMGYGCPGGTPLLSTRPWSIAPRRGRDHLHPGPRHSTRCALTAERSPGRFSRDEDPATVPASVFGGQECNDGGDVVGLAEPAQRDARDHSIPSSQAGVQNLHHPCTRVGWSTAVCPGQQVSWNSHDGCFMKVGHRDSRNSHPTSCRVGVSCFRPRHRV